MTEEYFDGAEITIYTKNGGQFSLDLSQIQTYTALKILGIKFGKGNTYSCHSDETLQELFKFKGNPLKLTEVR